MFEQQEMMYGQFDKDPTPEQLAKYFLLDDHDKIRIFKRKGTHNQLGFALQLGTVRFLGTFLTNSTDVPLNVIRYLSSQLKISENVLTLYEASKTHWSHRLEIKKVYGYHDFSEQPYHNDLVNWLYNHVWLSSERPGVLFDLIVARCIEHKILLPGITVLEKLISKTREQVSSKLWNILSSLPDSNQCKRLEKLLIAEAKNHKTELEILRRPVTKESLNGFLKAIERFRTIDSLGAHMWDLSDIPIGKIYALSRYASVARAQSIERMPYKRRIATLVSFAIIYTTYAQDDVVDYMQRYFGGLFNRVERKSEKERLRTLKDLDSSARELSRACKLLLDDEVPNEMMRETIFSNISKERLKSAIGTVDALTKPQDQTVEYKELFRYYNSIRKILPTLLKSINFMASSAGEPTLCSWKFLADIESKSGKDKFVGAPLEGVSVSWKKVILKGDKILPCPYIFWVLEKMIADIKNHDIYLLNSDRYGDPKSKLIQASDWERMRSKIVSTLGWSLNAKESLEPLKYSLDTAFKNTLKNWDSNSGARIETIRGKEKIVLSHIERLEEPETLILLRKRVDALIPNTDLPELLLEIASLTQFTDQFTHISQSDSRVRNLSISICAVLIAKACNIGIEPVAQSGIPELEYDRLTWVEQNYFRSETLKQANSVIVEYLTKLTLVKSWGSGDVASADGIRFTVPSKTIYAGANPKYFGIGRGITSYDLISDQFSGLNKLVITGTMRDSLYLLELVLGQDTIIKPREIMTDTAGYSDIIFGLFALLGYQFSPRIADIGASRFWRFDPDADYGVLNNLSKNKLREDLIVKYWDDMLRITGSLKLGAINPTNLIQMLQRSGKPTLLGRAIGEFGRIFRTTYQLSFVDDPNYRRRILIQLNRGESENGLKRVVMYGKKGELVKSYREGQEDQLNALGVVTNSIILWNTIYIESALDAIRKIGYNINTDDLSRLSPLGYDHINIVGHYHFNIPKEVLSGELRPLRPMDSKLFGNF